MADWSDVSSSVPGGARFAAAYYAANPSQPIHIPEVGGHARQGYHSSGGMKGTKSDAHSCPTTEYTLSPEFSSDDELEEESINVVAIREELDNLLKVEEIGPEAVGECWVKVPCFPTHRLEDTVGILWAGGVVVPKSVVAGGSFRNEPIKVRDVKDHNDAKVTLLMFLKVGMGQAFLVLVYGGHRSTIGRGEWEQTGALTQAPKSQEASVFRRMILVGGLDMSSFEKKDLVMRILKGFSPILCLVGILKQKESDGDGCVLMLLFTSEREAADFRRASGMTLQCVSGCRSRIYGHLKIEGGEYLPARMETPSVSRYINAYGDIHSIHINIFDS